MEPDRSLVLETTRRIWAEMLGMELQEDPAAAFDPRLFESHFIGSVQISGARELAVIIQLPLELARRATAAMLEVEPGEVTDAEVIDAVGELTNLVAGSLKNRIQGGSRLSLPTIVRGDHFTVCLPGSRKLFEVALTSVNWPAIIAIHERQT